MKNINKYLALAESAGVGLDTLFKDDDANSPWGAAGRKITLDKIVHGPPYVDITQTKRVVLVLWGFVSDMWGTTQIEDKKGRWRQFVCFADFGRIVYFKPGEEMTLAKIFGLPDCVGTSELTVTIGGQLAVILLLV